MLTITAHPFDRLYVGGLSSTVTEQSLRDAFELAGVHVGVVEMILDRATGAPRRFAFVDLDRSVDAALATKLSEVTLEGATLNIQGVPRRARWQRVTGM